MATYVPAVGGAPSNGGAASGFHGCGVIGLGQEREHDIASIDDDLGNETEAYDIAAPARHANAGQGLDYVVFGDGSHLSARPFA